ncbi:response regulator [Agrobacterium tomkonis]|uniref:response regulator n=1 Tax=Agrobacterium tomkonis TaxID=1183410 RepID=UPI001CD8FA9D
MIVDDEALIRFDLIDHFEAAGYTVFEAENADQAIAVLERHKSIRVVLTDVQMPGSMDGVRLAHYIRDRYPPTVLIVTSGALRLSGDDLPDQSVFISKPFNPYRILSMLDQML